MKDGRAYSQAMADDIRTYWMRKGYRVNVWVEEMALKDQTAKSKDAKIFWCIRSDINVNRCNRYYSKDSRSIQCRICNPDSC